MQNQVVKNLTERRKSKVNKVNEGINDTENIFNNMTNYLEKSIQVQL